MSEVQERPSVTIRAADALRKATPFVRLVRGSARRMGMFALAADAVIAYALLVRGSPDSTAAWVGRAIVVAILLVPPVVLGMLWLALGEIVELPSRIERLPADARSHIGQLADLWRDANEQRSRGFVGRLWRLCRLVSSSRELLTPYAPLLPFASGTFVVAAMLAYPAALVEIAVGVIVLVALAV